MQSQPSSTDHRNGVSFDQQDGSTTDGWTGHDAIGAYAASQQHAKSAESNPEPDLHPPLASGLEMSGTAASAAQHAVIRHFTRFGLSPCHLFLVCFEGDFGIFGRGTIQQGRFPALQIFPKESFDIGFCDGQGACWIDRSQPSFFCTRRDEGQQPVIQRKRMRRARKSQPIARAWHREIQRHLDDNSFRQDEDDQT